MKTKIILLFACAMLAAASCSAEAAPSDEPETLLFRGVQPESGIPADKQSESGRKKEFVVHRVCSHSKLLSLF